MWKDNSYMGVVAVKERQRPAGLPFRAALNLVLAALLAALALVPCSATKAAVINATSPSLADVTAAIHSAADGDTVTIPRGTATWTSTIKISKGLTLIGQTTTDPVHKTADDQTIISVNTGANGNTPVLVLDSALGKSYRVSGITFRTGQTQIVNSNGMLQLSGGSHAVRVDHCHFDNLAFENNNIAAWGAVYGVIDHNVFDFRSSNNRSQSVFFAIPGPESWGDVPWTQPTDFGSEKFVFVEDNCINNTSGNEFAGTIDGRQGGRWIFRHNHCYNMGIGSHGTEIGRYRGERAGELYNNDFHWTFAANVGGIRSGAFITHDNTYDGAQPQHGMTLGQYRVFIKIPAFGGSSGDNPWDYNVTEPNGTHVDGRPPYLFESGTAGAGSNRTRIVDTTKNWTTNRWAGYTAKRRSDSGIMLITSNTSNTLTGYYHDGYGGGVTWNAGDQYQIHKVLISMDQPCRGTGNLIRGDFDHPVNATTGTPSWVNQALEPAYSWNNFYTPTGARVNIELASGAWTVLREGRDFYNDRPMPGYKPYSYPHPLVSGQPPEIASATQRSQHYVDKSGERKAKKVKTWKWGRAKEKPAEETAEPTAPAH
jgi:hypothetical protein